VDWRAAGRLPRSSLRGSCGKKPGSDVRAESWGQVEVVIHYSTYYIYIFMYIYIIIVYIYISLRNRDKQESRALCFAALASRESCACGATRRRVAARVLGGQGADFLRGVALWSIRSSGL
jgi:hypothetical protein